MRRKLWLYMKRMICVNCGPTRNLMLSHRGLPPPPPPHPGDHFWRCIHIQLYLRCSSSVKFFFFTPHKKQSPVSLGETTLLAHMYAPPFVEVSKMRTKLSPPAPLAALQLQKLTLDSGGGWVGGWGTPIWKETLLFPSRQEGEGGERVRVDLFRGFGKEEIRKRGRN